MKMYIPSIGDEIVLTSNWEFGLWNERRNYDFLVFLGDVTKEYWDYFYSNKSMKSRPCVIPKGSLLKIDRIYIRKGVSDYDSITFYWKGLPPKPGSKSKKTRAIRFWVKLEDANKIEFKKASDHAAKRHTQIAAEILTLTSDREWDMILPMEDKIRYIGKVIEDHVKSFTEHLICPDSGVRYFTEREIQALRKETDEFFASLKPVEEHHEDPNRTANP